MLDAIHPDLPNPARDTNTYTLGSIGSHNIVIACLPKGRHGTTSAAVAATQMINTFPSIRVGLIVGISSGIPSKVRLRDVVVSTPIDQYPGVVQWDMGKAEGGNGCFKRTGALNNPRSTLLTALIVPKFTNSNSLEDPSSDPGVSERETRIHYGLIVSGNQVVKDASMEAAGLVNSFPCVVIRGIADYCDLHKDKDWQEFAAAVAAAYAKELLQCVQQIEIE
ncbi:nucleoside phosphorylase domain-containing protein [Aspergillus venezuelensis]